MRKHEDHQWLTLLALLLGVLTVFSNLYATQPVLPVLSTIFHIGPALSGLTVSITALCVGGAALIYGPLSDYLGRKPVMLVTAALLLLPTLAAAVAPNFTMLVLCRALQGVLIPGTTVVAIAYIQEEFPAHWRGTAMGAYVGATILGGVVSRLQGGFLADWLGWRWMFVSFAFSTSIGILLMWLYLPAKPPLSGEGKMQGGQIREIYLQLPGFFRQRQIMGASLVAFAFFFSFLSIFTYIPYRMQQPPFRLSNAAISLLYLVYLVSLLVAPWVGRLSDMAGRRILLGCTLVGMFVGELLTALPSLIAVLLGLTLLSAGSFATQTIATAYVGDHASSTKGGAASFYMLWYYLGGFVGPLLSGFLWQVWGWTGVLVVCLSMLGLAGSILCTVCTE